MGQYKSQYTGPQIDAGINAALNPDLVPTEGSDALITSDAVAKVQQGFAPIETAATSANSYAIGDLLVWGGVLYKAKTSITAGDSFVVDTNIEATTVADKLNNIDTEITSDTDTTLTGLLTGNGSKVGTKSLDTSGLTNDADHVPTSGVVKSVITKVESDLASIHATGSTNATGATITKNTYFYLNNVLVQAKADIASGATYTSGTNYETVTAGGLNDLQKIETIAVSHSSYLNWNDENCWVRRQGAVVNFSVQCSLNNGPIPAGTEIISGLPISYYDLIFNVIGGITDTPNPTFSVFYVWHGSVYTREAIPTTGNAYLYLQFCYICAK